MEKTEKPKGKALELPITAVEDSPLNTKANISSAQALARSVSPELLAMLEASPED